MLKIYWDSCAACCVPTLHLGAKYGLRRTLINRMDTNGVLSVGTCMKQVPTVVFGHEIIKKRVA